MQTPEEFMREFLVAYAAEEERQRESRKPFRQKFFTEDCIWYSREGEVDRIRAQVIESVEASESDAKVITRNEGPAGGPKRLRYRLKPSGETWLVQDVGFECISCLKRSTIDPGCRFCGGMGWFDQKSMERFRTRFAKERRNPPGSGGQDSGD